LSEPSDTIRDRLALPAVGVAAAGAVACGQGLFILALGWLNPLAVVDPHAAPWMAFASWGPLPGVVIVAGAAGMLRLRFYWLAVTSPVLAVLPVSLGCVVGLPAGLWALGLLLRPEVKAAFRHQARVRAAAYQAQMRRLDEQIDADLREPPGSPWSGTEAETPDD
jgi:hypothetical protein